MKSNKYDLIVDNLTVVFNNNFNKKTIAGLTGFEYNLLFGLLGKLKDKGISEISIPFEEAGALMKSPGNKPSHVISTVDSLWKKIKMTDYALYVQGRDGLKPAGGVLLFSMLTVDRDNQEVRLKLNQDLEYFLNSFNSGSYTSLKLSELHCTSNRYGKLLFKLLSQYKTTGFYKEKRAGLIYKMDCPPSYDIKKFHSLVLDPAIASIRELLPGLKLTKIKNGRTITHYEFNFTPKVNSVKYDVGFKSTKKKKNKNEFIKIDSDDKPYSNNFKNDYLPGQNSPTKIFKAWLQEINLFKGNDEYFEMRSKSKTDLMSIYKSKVIDADNKYWTDMRFFASAYSVIINDKAMTSWNIEDAYSEIRKGKRLDIPQEVYSSLPEDKGNELQEFALKGEII